jgi:hypothetical protein
MLVLWKSTFWRNISNLSSGGNNAVVRGSAGSWLADSFYPEGGGDTFFRNVGSQKIYAVQYPIRQHFL